MTPTADALKGLVGALRHVADLGCIEIPTGGSVPCDDCDSCDARAYGTRHGAGPFPGEDLGAPAPPGEHNGQSRQGRFRVGALDGVLLRYALAADGNVSQLAVTCLDHADARRPPVIGYGGILAGAPMHPLFHHLAGGENRQLRVQEDRGRILAGAEPVFAAGPWDAAAFADWTGLPVAIESRGPRAEDKTWAA